MSSSQHHANTDAIEPDQLRQRKGQEADGVHVPLQARCEVVLRQAIMEQQVRGVSVIAKKIPGSIPPHLQNHHDRSDYDQGTVQGDAGRPLPGESLGKLLLKF